MEPEFLLAPAEFKSYQSGIETFLNSLLGISKLSLNLTKVELKYDRKHSKFYSTYKFKSYQNGIEIAEAFAFVVEEAHRQANSE